LDDALIRDRRLLEDAFGRGYIAPFEDEKARFVLRHERRSEVAKEPSSTCRAARTLVQPHRILEQLLTAGVRLVPLDNQDGELVAAALVAASHGAPEGTRIDAMRNRVFPYSFGLEAQTFGRFRLCLASRVA
jgi:hypothetical protein